jgi:2-polyprenyl-6-hydroxyphenyl methylase/3-demethylubiquinone-9 3-methyltransferase
VDYQLISAEELAAQQAGQYDIVTCMEMLEHVPDPGSTIAACSTLLKPGGWAFFSTINRNPKSYLFAIIGAEYVLNLLPKGTHDYKNFIRPSELETWTRAANIKLKDLTGMSYNPLTQQYSLGRDLSVNYLGYGMKEM